MWVSSRDKPNLPACQCLNFNQMINLRLKNEKVQSSKIQFQSFKTSLEGLEHLQREILCRKLICLKKTINRSLRSFLCQEKPLRSYFRKRSDLLSLIKRISYQKLRRMMRTSRCIRSKPTIN